MCINYTSLLLVKSRIEDLKGTHYSLASKLSCITLSEGVFVVMTIVGTRSNNLLTFSIVYASLYNYNYWMCHIDDRLGNACQSFFRPLASIKLAGMQYTGSMSSNPG